MYLSLLSATEQQRTAADAAHYFLPAFFVPLAPEVILAPLIAKSPVFCHPSSLQPATSA